MKKPKPGTIEVKSFGDHHVITQPNPLREVLVRVPESDLDDPVARAEKALAGLSGEFKDWIFGLADTVGRAKIAARLSRLEMGNPGDVRPVGDGISEMRIPHGPGYRVYYEQTGRTMIVILCGGDKSTQANDIKRAKAMAAELGD